MQGATRATERPPAPPLADDVAEGAEALERRIQRIGRDIFAHALSATPTALQPEWWQQRLLEWAMRDGDLRTRLFRFVDVLPALRSSHEVAAHLAEYLRNGSTALPAALEHALRFDSPDSLRARVVALATRRGVRQMARRFIAGETPEEAIGTIRRLRRQRMAYTLDLLGEAVTSESQADEYARRQLELMEVLDRVARGWPAVAQIDSGPDGPLPRVNVSLKLSALYSQFDAVAAERCAATVGRRLRPVLRHARERGAFVYVDMEDYQHKDMVLDIFQSILLEDEFRDLRHIGIVLQAYLREAERDLGTLIDWVKRRGHPISIRLVKGAYWDSEVVRAAQHGWPCPVFLHKGETDAMFERLTRTLIEHHDLVRPAIASHNVRSLAHAIALAEIHGLADGSSASGFEIQMLFGMGDPLKAALVRRGLRLRIYTPCGPLIPGMAYLIRRLLENTSNDSFLRQSFSEHVPVDELLEPPAAMEPRRAHPPEHVALSEEDAMALANEPLTDFSIASNRDAMAIALRDVRERLCGASYALLIGGQSVQSGRTLDSVDPSRADFLVGRVACASSEDADRAVAAARRAWPSWRRTSAEERAALLTRLADHMRQRRFELGAWEVIEVGKPWLEADADVAEAIDYCEFYGHEMLRLAQPRQRTVPGEENLLVHEPRGVAAIIAPWNFPLAILTGMTTAALVAGNTVVVKPAEQSPVVAAKFFELCVSAGLPPGVANFLPGLGEEVGARLVAHPDVDLIAFTGSRDVGLRIIESAARMIPGQRTVKRVVAEMGGKNAIIVDSDADLDEALRGVMASAFGYAGQKCSACSRVIVLSAVHDTFLKRLVESTRSLRVGPADDPATMVGPLIDAPARERVLRYIDLGQRQAALACRVDHDDDRGFFVGPVIFDRVPRDAPLAQEEIFGPVLAVLTAGSFDEALEIANDTDYGLTGGVYSRSPQHIARAKREFRVGNLYVNRPITGAVVDRQPFGGLKLSGIGSKAGGSDYLLQFCEPRTITENTVRHGFAPNL